MGGIGVKNRKFFLKIARGVILLAMVSTMPLKGEALDGSDDPAAWFGTDIPGMIPELIDPGILTAPGTRPHGALAISPEGKEIYWPVIPPRVLVIFYENGSWTEPETASFSELNIQAPSFSPDGEQVFFQISGPGGHGSLDIWRVVKGDKRWGDKENLGSPPNSPLMESQPSVARSGNLYFTGFYDGGHMDRGIFRSEYSGGGYLAPELLPESINSESLDYTPFISPDESFLLFSSTRPGREESDIRLYTSFRRDDGTWTEPENLNLLMGFDRPSRFPSLTPDGRFLVFMSGGGYYWVDAGIIEQCRGYPGQE